MSDDQQMDGIDKCETCGSLVHSETNECPACGGPISEEVEIEQGMRIMREHMLADHIIRATNLPELTTLVAGMFGVMDGMADALGNNAMILRRSPGMRETIADQLEEMSTMLRAMVPVAREDSGTI